jgi:hypothetical protein
VPFGICQEPTNIKAHGQACPFRHQEVVPELVEVSW